jgi:hypothetical protein
VIFYYKISFHLFLLLTAEHTEFTEIHDKKNYIVGDPGSIVG